MVCPTQPPIIMLAMIRPGLLRWAVFAAAALILPCQLLVRPILGVANNGDFLRMGLFGYGPKDTSQDAKFNYVGEKYVRDPAYRDPFLEQFTSEYFLAGAALCAARTIAPHGEMDIRLVGLVHHGHVEGWPGRRRGHGAGGQPNERRRARPTPHTHRPATACGRLLQGHSGSCRWPRSRCPP